MYVNYDLYTLNNRSLLTILTVNGPIMPLGSRIVRLEVKGIDNKPLISQTVFTTIGPQDFA
jgi:hypothetical protein